MAEFLSLIKIERHLKLQSILPAETPAVVDTSSGGSGPKGTSGREESDPTGIRWPRVYPDIGKDQTLYLHLLSRVLHVEKFPPITSVVHNGNIKKKVKIQQ